MWARYVDRECANGLTTTRVDMNFTGISKDDFQLRYAKGVVAALAAVVQLPASAVTAYRIREVHYPRTPAGGRRRLLQDTTDGESFTRVSHGSEYGGYMSFFRPLGLRFGGFKDQGLGFRA